MAGWIAAGVAVALLIIAYLTYRVERNRKRLSYVLTTNSELLPGDLSRRDDIALTHAGTAILDPALLIVRIVNTGDVPITAEDFETPLAVRFEGIAHLASATLTATRPADLMPDVTIAGTRVDIGPKLINPGDMLQLQVLSSGKANKVELSGRIADLTFDRLDRLPYPPGSGEEGEMNAIDRFMWWVPFPAAILGLGLGIGLDQSHDYPTATRAIIIGSGVALALVAYPLYARHLVRRRRLWRPE